LVRRVPGERIELERNPHFRDAANVAIDRVVHLAIADLATELNLYRAGDLDLTSEVPNTQLESLRREHPAELRLAPYLSTYAYAVNLARLPDAGARTALAMAVDRDRIAGQVTGAGERPAFGWVPDGIPGYAPARFEWQDLPYPQAATRAREFWQTARAAGKAPTKIKLCTDASANHHRTAIALADLWRTALGVETEIVELEWNVYLDTRRNPGDCDLVRLGWSADFVDPEAFADVFESGNPQNTLGYHSAAYDGLLTKSRTETDGAKRMALLARAEQQLLSDVPVIPVFFRASKRLVKPYVEGYQANPLGHVASRDLRLNSR
jgi:oligopeptide transport system substrate-binding protein